MSNKPFPALCRDCRFGKPQKDFGWNNVCMNPKVNAQSSWALANNHEGEPAYTQCQSERERRSPFAACGMKGKLWEPKP